MEYNPPWNDNDGRYPKEADVEIWYPAPSAGDFPDREKGGWQWYPGYVVDQVGYEEWEVVVEHADHVRLDDEGEPVYPVCFRDSSELRMRQDSQTGGV